MIHTKTIILTAAVWNAAQFAGWLEYLIEISEILTQEPAVRLFMRGFSRRELE